MKVTFRSCIGCRQIKSKDQLLRIVRNPAGEVKIDEKGEKDGRGAYVCFFAECLEKALKNHRLEKALKVKVPAEVLSLLRELMTKAG